MADQRHPKVTYVNAVNGRRQARCYPNALAAYEEAATYRPYNNTRVTLGHCQEQHDPPLGDPVAVGRTFLLDEHGTYEIRCPDCGAAVHLSVHHYGEGCLFVDSDLGVPVEGPPTLGDLIDGAARHVCEGDDND